MTREEFDIWIEQHYGDLLAVAKTLTKRDAEDVTQRAVLAMVEQITTADQHGAVWPNKCLVEDQRGARPVHCTCHNATRVIPHTTPEQRANGYVSLWPWAKGQVRGAAMHAQRSMRRNGTKGLPGHLKGEERTGRDTRIEQRSRLPKLTEEQKGVRAADDYYLKRLERDRKDFDMDGYGRSKKDKPFEVRLPGDVPGDES